MNTHINLIYLASPFSNPERSVREQRYRDAVEATALLLKEGVLTYSPIVHNYVIANTYNLPSEFEWWKLFDSVMISRCDAVYVLMLPGWKESTGVTQEIKLAQELGKPVKYIKLDELIWHPHEIVLRLKP